MTSNNISNNQEKTTDIQENWKNLQFLDDDPVEDDFFGCHKRVARSISEQIESGLKGKTIGLEGTWGSGKSSIIKMLEERWSKGEYKNENIRLFTYDAWEHQGDPLRRAFLEELITSLQEDGIDNKRWLKECKIEEHEFEHCLDECSKKDRLNCPDFIRDNLRLRYEHNVIKTEPTISGKGIAFGILTLLMPICLSFVLIIPKWWNIIPGILASVPVLFILIYLLWLKFIERKDCKEILGEFFGKSKETTKHTTQRAPEPTTIEFQGYYEKIISLALEDNKLKLVIVVDNLDRVEAETALKVWGTMRTFLEKTNYKDKEMISRIWVVVPYDVEAIEKLWLNAKKEPDKELALAFKEKTFQIRYHVPAPLTSKWEDYFNDKLKEAIGEQEGDTNHKIFQIFRIIALPEYNNIPTPREMKIFINRVVALAKQFDPKEVILEEIALYAAVELSPEKKLENLAGEIKGESQLISFAGDDFREGLAAIHYGVARSEANEVLYGPKIRSAIEEGNSEELTKLLDEPAAQKVCNNYLTDNVYYWENLEELLTASSAFAGFESKRCSNHVKRCLKTMAEQLNNINDKHFKINGSLSEDNIDDLIRLMKFHPNIISMVKGRISIGMSKKDYGDKSDDEFDSIIKEWVKAVIKIMKFIRSREIDPTIHISLSDPIYYKKLLTIIIEENEGIEYLKYFCPKNHIREKYFKAYFQDIEAGTIRTKDVDIIDGILDMACISGDDEKTIASSLTKPYLNLTADKVPIVYDILYKYRQKQSFNEQLALLANKAEAFKVLHKFNTNHSVVALCYVNIFKYGSVDNYEEGKIPADVLQTYSNLLEDMPKELANEIAKAIVKYNLFNEICDSVDYAIKQRNCWGQILQYMVKDENAIKCISSKRFIDEHEYIKDLLDEDVEEEDKKLNYYKILVEYLLGNGLIGNLVDEPISRDYGHAYYIALTMENIDTKSLEEKLCKELEDIETDDWFEELRDNLDEYGILGVVIELVKRKCKVGLKHEFVDALIQHAKALSNKEKEIDGLEDSWGYFLGALTDSERKDFQERLLDLITELNISVKPILGIYKAELYVAIEEADLHRKRSFVNKVCKRIAKDQESQEIKWMLELFHEKEHLLKKAKKDDRVVIKDRLENYLRDEYAKDESKEELVQEQVSKEVIENVAKQLGISLITENSEESDDNTDKELRP